MKNLLKLGLFVAAGYGTYEILRRAGMLEKAGAWLQDNVPEDVQAKVRDHVQQAKDQAQRLQGQAGEQYGNLKSKAAAQLGNVRGQAQQLGQQAGDRLGQARDAVTNKWNGSQPASNTESTQPPVAEEGGRGELLPLERPSLGLPTAIGKGRCLLPFSPREKPAGTAG